MLTRGQILLNICVAMWF